MLGFEAEEGRLKNGLTGLGECVNLRKENLFGKKMERAIEKRIWFETEREIKEWTYRRRRVGVNGAYLCLVGSQSLQWGKV